jgi:hypothetical protein
VQVHYGEGVAIRIGPEPCVGTREGDGEASVGERVGQPLSRESLKQSGRRCGQNHGRRHGRARQREHPPGPAWSKTLACVEVPCLGSREVSGLARGWTPRVRIGKTRSRNR